MKLTTDLDAVREIHAQYYAGEFSVAVCKRSGGMDFPPFSWVYGISDVGSWDCIVSCNGEKLVVTKSGYWDIEKVTAVFTIEKGNIQQLKIGTFKNAISLSNKIKGIGKSFKFRIEEEFNGEGAIKGELNKCLAQLAG